jgi:hypothetical protein
MQVPVLPAPFGHRSRKALCCSGFLQARVVEVDVATMLGATSDREQRFRLIPSSRSD